MLTEGSVDIQSPGKTTTVYSAYVTCIYAQCLYLDPSCWVGPLFDVGGSRKCEYPDETISPVRSRLSAMAEVLILSGRIHSSSLRLTIAVNLGRITHDEDRASGKA